MVPPLFPWLLALVFRFWGLYSVHSAFVILTLNSLFSALTCIPIYLSTRHILGVRAARIAGLAWVVYPYAIYFAADRVWDYALTGLLFSTCFWAALCIGRHARLSAWFGMGVLFGLTCLSNPSVATSLLALLLLAIAKGCRRREPWFSQVALTLVGLLAVILPWGLRNYRVLHIVTPVRDGFWLEVWAGNNGDTFESNARWAHPASNPEEMHKYVTLGESAYMAEKKQLALDFIRPHPVLFIGLCIRRILRFWTGFWSLSRAYLTLEPLDIPNILFSTTLTLFMLRGLRRLWAFHRFHALAFATLLLVFPFPYYLSHSSPDYRQPLEPQIVSLVTFGIFGLGSQQELPIDSDDDEVAAEEAEPELVMARS